MDRDKKLRRYKVMKIRDLREATFAKDNYAGHRYMDGKVNVTVGWAIFEGPEEDCVNFGPSWRSVRALPFGTIGELMEAIDEGKIKGNIPSDVREEIEDKGMDKKPLSIVDILHLPDDFEIGYKYCHRLVWHVDPEDDLEIEVIYIFHDKAKDENTKKAHECRRMYPKVGRKPRAGSK